MVDVYIYCLIKEIISFYFILLYVCVNAFSITRLCILTFAQRHGHFRIRLTFQDFCSTQSNHYLGLINERRYLFSGECLLSDVLLRFYKKQRSRSIYCLAGKYSSKEHNTKQTFACIHILALSTSLFKTQSSIHT